MTGPRFTLPARLARLRADESGNTLIYVTLSASVILGMIGLALDGSRAMITHSEAQGAADAAALAAASQLDGQSGACDRAKAEAAAVTNRQRFAQGGGGDITIAAGSPRLLSGLPASDSGSVEDMVLPDDASCDPAGRYVEVRTQQLTHQNTLLSALTSQNTTLIQRTATAGFRRSLCAAGPVLMACSPFNWQPGVAYDAWTNDGSNKGFITKCGNSANCVEDTLAAATPQFCTEENEDDPAPGNNTNKARDGINTRFGQGSKNDPPSDTDVVDFKPYSNDIPGGTGGWRCADYWAAYHASDGLAKPAGCTNGTSSVTRYSVYQAERAANKIPTKPPNNIPTTTEERRLLYIALVNCANGNLGGAYVKAFMLTPAVAGGAKNIWVEPIGLITSKTDPTVLHEEVQLYR
jgi:hypothetical protein